MSDAPSKIPQNAPMPEEPSLAQTLIAEDEKANMRSSLTEGRTPRQTASQSEYQNHVRSNSSSQNQQGQNFGHKLPTPSPHSEKPGLRLPQGFETRGPQIQNQNSRPLPERPSVADLARLVHSPIFRGPAQGSPLHQKIDQRILQHSMPTLAQPQHDTPTLPLERSELLQLFSMRHRPDINKEERDALRRLIHFEVQAQKHSKERVASIQYDTQTQHQEEKTQGMQKTSHLQNHDSARQDLMNKLARTAESVFERILQRALGGEQASVKNLPEGHEPDLPVKTSEEWELFFKNTTALSSQLQEASAEQNNLSKILYRGLFQSEGQLKLVSDLSLHENGEVNQYKFAQILLSDPKFADLLQSIKPGQPLPMDLIRALGEQVAFLKLVHAQAGMQDMTEEDKRLLLKEFRREISLGYQSELEKALQNRRKKPSDPFVWAGDQFDKKEERKGLQTVMMYLIYFVLIGMGAVIIYILVQSLL